MTVFDQQRRVKVYLRCEFALQSSRSREGIRFFLPQTQIYTKEFTLAARRYGPGEAAINSGRRWIVRIFPTIAEREETPVLIMISRRKALTVLGLTFIRFAISLFLIPCNKCTSTSCSRCVRLNCWQTCDNGTGPRGARSSKTAVG